VGAGLAWLIVTYRFPGCRALEWALVLPLAMPAYVIGFALLGLFDFSGPVQSALRRWMGPGARLPEFRSYWGVVLTMTLVFYPYVYLLARAAFREQGAATLETARSLGRSQMRAFVAVTLPLARPSLVAGVSLAMMEALADFGTVATFGYRTLTEAVYRVWYGMFDRAAAAQLASLPAALRPVSSRPRAIAPRPRALSPRTRAAARCDATPSVRMEGSGRDRHRLRRPRCRLRPTARAADHLGRRRRAGAGARPRLRRCSATR
jgi:ABC-type molybdate transport system permease subunit